MKSLEKAGGVAALIAAATYIVAMALAVSVLRPMVDAGIGFHEYMDFLADHATIVYLWHFTMYLINGACLVVLVVAIHERLEPSSPNLAKIATTFGLIWTAFVILSGVITNYGVGALIALYGKDPAQAESLKVAFDVVTVGIDSSDKFAGCLWVGLVSLASFKPRVFPRVLAVFGMAISVMGLAGTTIPSLVAISYVFGLGAIVWWIGAGVCMLSARPKLASV
jgi:hypothetical protein